jgi:aspartate-semialdehyde dehydrogenase
MVEHIKSTTESTTKLTTSAFKSQILLNCFSHNSAIDLESGYNGEELKIIQETSKILGKLEVSATCVRIPVMRAHCESVKIVFSYPVTESDLRSSLESMSGVKIMDDRESNSFPEPIYASGKTDVFVGRIRKDYFDTSGKTWHMFLCGDQLLKGAAWNAYQIFYHGGIY